MKSLQNTPHEIATRALLPDPLRELTGLARQPMLSLDRVARALEADPEARSEVLRRTNSVAVVPRAGVRDLQQALPLLGDRTIRPLIWESLLRQTLPFLEGRGIDGETWLKQIQAGAELAGRLHDRLFPKGLIELGDLHDSVWMRDLGKLVLVFDSGFDYAQVVEQARRTGAPLARVEQETLGTTHAEVASALASIDGMGERLIVAWKERYTPHRAPLTHLPYVALLHLSDVLAWRRVSSDGFGGGPPKLETRLFERLGIEGSALDRLLQKVRD